MPITVKTTKGEVIIRDMLTSDLTHLKNINSFVISSNDNNVSFSDEEAFELIYQFLKTPAETRAILSKGRPVFREEAMVNVADIYSYTDIADLVKAIVEQLNVYFKANQIASETPSVPVEQ